MIAVSDNDRQIPSSLSSPITVFGLLRHGTTKWNVEKRIQGHSDTPLTQEGRRKTVAWSHFLKSFQWDRILASDLDRVKETVSILNKVLDIPVSWDERLKEQYWGHWEGLKISDVKKQNPKLLRQQLASGWDFKPPQGESRRSVQQRASTALVEAANRWPEKKILIICHQGVMKCLLYHIVNRSFLPEETQILQKDRLQTITLTGKTFKVLQLNIAPETL